MAIYPIHPGNRRMGEWAPTAWAGQAGRPHTLWGSRAGRCRTTVGEGAAAGVPGSTWCLLQAGTPGLHLHRVAGLLLMLPILQNTPVNSTARTQVDAAHCALKGLGGPRPSRIFGMTNGDVDGTAGSGVAACLLRPLGAGGGRTPPRSPPAASLRGRRRLIAPPAMLSAWGHWAGTKAHGFRHGLQTPAS